MKKILFFTFIMCLLVTSSFGLDSDYIDVGLNYGNQIDSVIISFDNGMALGYNKSDDFEELITFGNVKSIIVKRDMKYNIKSNNSYGSLRDAQGDLKEVQNSGYSAYILIDNGIFICVADFDTQSSASSSVKKIKSATGINMELLEDSKNFVKIYSGNKILLGYNTLDNRDLYLKSKGLFFQYNGKKYRNGIKFFRMNSSDLTVINRLLVDEYLYGVVPKEMNESWPKEALKAQAVTARGFAIKSMGKHNEFGFDVCSTTDCQAYGGYDSEKAQSNEAVDETSGELLYYGSEIANTYYHSNSGGTTANIKDIWGSDYPYLVSVDDEFSIGAPNSSWKLEYSSNELDQLISDKGLSIGKIQDIEVLERSLDGRVTKLELNGTLDSKILSKEESRKFFGYTKLKSLNFDLYKNESIVVKNDDKTLTSTIDGKYIISGDQKVTKTDANNVYVAFSGKEAKELTCSNADFTIYGRGFGHGIGMSQYGAKKMAELGYTYDKILYHYYKGTSVR